MSTSQQDNIFGREFLESIFEWVINNMEDDIIDWIKESFDPPEIFSEGQLENWALSSGFEDKT